MSNAIKWAAITASLLGVLAAPASAATGKAQALDSNAKTQRLVRHRAF